MKNKIGDLRDHLFATLEALRDEEKPMEIERAREIANVAKVIVDSARAENDFIRATGALKGSGFIPAEEGARQLAAGSPEVRICRDCRNTTTTNPCEHCRTPMRKSA